MYVPDKGDIVSLDFDPSAGKEIMKRRPAFVISRKMFNEHTGFAVVAPITSTVRGMKLEVVLPEDLSTQGAILIHQVKSLDFSNRQVKFIEKAPQAITDKATELTKVIIS
ncbi:MULTISPECIES: type II toxin-antitoxin system PemK/MazF family toxin [Vibrio harveyi group]|uniref:type II toxin-antitoxin system PemK/MazF family toxin n=1 Tax=Vibrio harveyi group TaxID=717610 RepID=UPI000CD352A1|nr:MULTISPECIES: type II toxin-antitoxin system PemK/MazF family toxin [Vibrio harveyi group]AUW07584.1 PemK family transcriptional regulator [Vibrio campbellii]MBY7719735.1 type II toxin-antitoxin system PemK/MazF family toxin [Vibrio parahaemolyticus]